MGKRTSDGPPEDGREWVRADVAAKMVGLQQEYFVKVARKYEMTRYCPKRRGWFSWYLREEVASWAELKVFRRDWLRRHARYPGKRYTEKIDMETARRLFISTKEAAAILGVGTATVRKMVYSGRLVCYQSVPGQCGSRLWFSRRSVRHLLEDEERAKHRARYVRGAEREKERLAWAGFREPQPVEPVGRAHGNKLPEGWLTTQQAALRLGVRPGQVRNLGRIGRLWVQRLWKRNRMLCYWYFEAAQVEALLEEEGYQKWRACYRATKEPEPETTVEQWDRLLKVIEAHREPPELPEPDWACDRYRY